MFGGFSFSTQDKLKKYCKKEGIFDLSLIITDDSENIVVDHTNVLEMINYCTLGDYIVATHIVHVINDILLLNNPAGDLAEKALFYR